MPVYGEEDDFLYLLVDCWLYLDELDTLFHPGDEVVDVVVVVQVGSEEGHF